MQRGLCSTSSRGAALRAYIVCILISPDRNLPKSSTQLWDYSVTAEYSIRFREVDKANYHGEYSKGIDWQDYTLPDDGPVCQAWSEALHQARFATLSSQRVRQPNAGLSTLLRKPFSMSNSFAFRWQIRLALNGVTNRSPKWSEGGCVLSIWNSCRIWR
jgi:hypothetical protein